MGLSAGVYAGRRVVTYRPRNQTNSILQNIQTTFMISIYHILPQNFSLCPLSRTTGRDSGGSKLSQGFKVKGALICQSRLVVLLLKFWLEISFFTIESINYSAVAHKGQTILTFHWTKTVYWLNKTFFSLDKTYFSQGETMLSIRSTITLKSTLVERGWLKSIYC